MFENILETINKEEWEFKTLGEISRDIYKGCNIKERHVGTGVYPVIRNTISKLPRKLYESQELVNPDLIHNKKYCERGDIVVSAGGNTNLARNCVYLGKDKCIINCGLLAIKHNQNPNFLSWALASGICKKEIRKSAKGKGFSYIEIYNLEKTKVPIPPKHVQELIANFLDALEEHKDELIYRIKQEIALIKKICEYYKNHILEIGDHTTLEEIITHILKGQDVTTSQLGTGNHPAIRNTLSKLPRKLYECVDFVDPNLIKNKKYCEHGDIVICTTGSVGRNCVYLGQEKCILGNDLISIKYEENPNFLSWALAFSDCKKQIRKCSKRATISRINPKDLVKIQVPIILREEQSAVADILDELFDIQQQLERELERELELIDKQFKYYRDALIWKKLPTTL